MTNEEYIHINREKDIRPLALKKAPEGVDVSWCLQQIEGYQLAKKKLPAWANTEGIWFPPRISMEQCSSEATAIYKRSVAERLTKGKNNTSLIDLTGGFGVDFSYMSQNFDKALYVEKQEILCNTARHNFKVFNLKQARISNTDGTTILDDIDCADIIYLDPARRSDRGRKTIAISDCTPDITTLQYKLFHKSRHVMIKLSPMLDITQALRHLEKVKEIHTVSVKGECKELLFVLDSTAEDTCTPAYHCINLLTNDAPLTAGKRKESASVSTLLHEQLSGMLLFEPNASIMKAGLQAVFATQYDLQQLHPQSNLFICSPETVAAMSKEKREHIPARSFLIVAASDFSKSSTRELLKDVKQGNLTVRNFPTSVANLKKKLKLHDGGEFYFFATTLHDERHALIKCVPYQKKRHGNN